MACNGIMNDLQRNLLNYFYGILIEKENMLLITFHCYGVFVLPEKYKMKVELYSISIYFVSYISFVLKLLFF